MTEFLKQIEDRIAAATRSLAEARRDGDEYLVQVRSGEIESLQRLIDEHRSTDVVDLEPSAPAVDASGSRPEVTSS